MFHIIALVLAVGQVSAGIPPPTGPNPRCQTCCCGTLHGDKWSPLPDRKTRCCGKEYYDPDRNTCCNGKLNVGFPEYSSKCCQDKAYDPNHFTGCRNIPTEATATEDQCCGGLAYNQKREICCDGVLHARSRNSRCCGDKEYNPYDQICCKGELTEGCTKDMRCCFNVGFDPHKKVCVDPLLGTLEDSPALRAGEVNGYECGDDVWVPCDDTCCPKSDGTYTLTPGRPVTRATGCCGGERYAIHSELCCAEHLQPAEANPKKHLCCHNKYYNPHTHTCCGNPPKVVMGVGLCCGPDSVFDPKREICCDGQVFPGCPSRTKCCYDAVAKTNSPYDTKTQLCCNGCVAIGGKRRQCCGIYSFDPKFKTCCDKALVDRNEYRKTNVCDEEEGSGEILGGING